MKYYLLYIIQYKNIYSKHQDFACSEISKWQFLGVYLLDEIIEWSNYFGYSFANDWNDKNKSIIIFDYFTGKIFIPNKKNKTNKKSCFCYWRQFKRKRRKLHFKEWKVIKYQKNPEMKEFKRGNSFLIDYDYFNYSKTLKSWKDQTKYRKQWMKRVDKNKNL